MRPPERRDAADRVLWPESAAQRPVHDPPHGVASCTPCSIWRTAAHLGITVEQLMERTPPEFRVDPALCRGPVR